MSTWQDIPGWLYPEEGAELQRLAAGRTVLEIGSLFGRSTVCMALVAAEVHSVDPHDTRSLEPGVKWHGELTLQPFLDNLQAFGVSGKVTVYVGGVEEVAISRMFGLVFIDGDHSFEACSRDIDIAMRVLLPGGTIAVHDYNSGYPNHEGVKRAVDQWRATGVRVRRVRTLAVAEGLL